MIEESTNASEGANHLLRVEAGAVTLDGVLNIPPDAHGLVLLPQSFEDDTFRSYMTKTALSFNQRKLATLQVEMFTPEEKELETWTGYFGQNTDIMQQRFSSMADWLLEYQETRNFSIGYFGTGAIGAATLLAAAERPDNVRAVVAAGGSIGLIRTPLSDISAPVLLIAAGNNTTGVEANQQLLTNLKGPKEFKTIDGLQELFSEQRGVDEITDLAGAWFARWLVTIV